MAQPVEPPAVITTKPRFEHQNGVLNLVISDIKQRYVINWGSWGVKPEIRPVPVSLDTNRIYAFTVAQRIVKGRAFPELRRIQSAGQTIYDIEVCEVHKTRMELKEAPVTYGMMKPRREEPSGVMVQHFFPHSRDFVWGGDRPVPDRPTTENVYVCSECQAAEARWRAEVLRKKADERQRLLSATKPFAYKMGSLEDGGTLSGVARLFYGDARKWRQIYNANSAIIKDPHKLTGRETLTIPKI